MEGWIDLTLRWYMVGLLILFNVGLILAIAGLTIVSKSKSGFVEVQSIVAKSFISIRDFTEFKDWAMHILWTSLPTFIISLYAAWFVAVVSAARDRQPYIELFRGARGDHSVLLDYRNMTIPLIGSLRNRHWILSVFIVASIIANFSLTSLTSSLFSEGTSNRDSQSSMLIGSTFNGAAVADNSSLKSAIDIVSSALVYNASFPPWTSADYAFPSFTLADSSAKYTSATSITTNLTAYSAQADCVSLPIQGNVSGSGIIQAFEFSVSDRGCDFHESVLIGGGETFFAYSFLIDCPATAGWSRMVVFTAVIDDGDTSSPQDLNIISCIPSYHQVMGDLTVNIAPATRFWNGSFAPNLTTDTTFRPTAWSSYENQLAIGAYCDPTNTMLVTTFGLLVANYSQVLSGSPIVQSLALVQSAEQVIRSLFAVTSHIYFLQPLQQPVLSAGTLSTQVNRLFVVSTVAWIMISVLMFLCVIAISVLVYTYRHNSILTEETHGILGVANIVSLGICEDLAHEYRNKVNTENTENTENAENTANTAGKQSFNKFIHDKNIKDRKFHSIHGPAGWVIEENRTNDEDLSNGLLADQAEK